eukprot:gene20412-62571_t
MRRLFADGEATRRGRRVAQQDTVRMVLEGRWVDPRHWDPRSRMDRLLRARARAE